MPVVIYGIHASPPVRGVLLTAKAIGLDIDFKICNIFEGENKSEEFRNVKKSLFLGPSLVCFI